MRKLLITGCVLVLLVQISCGGGSSSDNASPPTMSLNKSAGSSTSPTHPGQTPPAGDALAKTTSAVPRSKEFFAPDDVKPPALDPFPATRRVENPDITEFPPIGKKAAPTEPIEPVESPEEPEEPEKVVLQTDQEKPDEEKNGIKETEVKKPDKKKKDFKIGPLVPPDMPKDRKLGVPDGDLDSEDLRLGGKTIDEWIKDISSPDRSKGENAIRTVVLFGPKLSQRAAPHIIAELRKHTARQPLDVSIRVNGVIALGEILADGNESDPRIVELAVEELRKRLRDDQVVVKVRAAHAVAKIGPAAAAAIPELTKNLYELSTWETRHSAAIALGQVGRHEKKGPNLDAMRALYGVLKADKNTSQVRLAAIQGLTYLGPPPKPDDREIVREKLDEVAFDDPEGTVQIWAHMAVMSIGGQIETERLVHISRHLQSRELTVRIQAAKALWAIGQEAKSEVPNLVAALDDREPAVVYWTMAALQEMNRWGEDALPKLQTLKEDEKQHAMIRHMAEQTIDIVQGKATKDKKKK